MSHAAFSRLTPARPWISAAAFGLAYFAVASAMIAWSRFDGGVAHIWGAAALLTAQLMRRPTDDWVRWCVAAGIASTAATSLFGVGAAVAIPLAFVNVGESLIGAGLLRRLKLHDDYLATLGNVGLFVLCAGIIAPLLTAYPAALLVSGPTRLPADTLWRDWATGHALGMLVVAPLATVILRNEALEWARGMSWRKRAEAVALVLATAGVCVVAFGQERVPLLFLPMLPMIVMTFRLDRIGAAIGVVVLVAIGSWLTAIGHGPITGLPGTAAHQSLLLQIYFAVSVLTVLPAAAELRQRKELFRQLRESEARYKLITENASDIVLELDVNGRVRYVSPSVTEITGFQPDQLIGKRPQQLLSGPDVRTFLAAHRNVRRQPGATTKVEYRAPDASGALKWFEANTRGMFSPDGELVGSISAIRDISHRKALEMRLAYAATTDALTGLGNRRAFDALLDRRIEANSQGCVAIFDIDYFKHVNDAHGHAVGDQVLASFASIAQRMVRGDDYVARLGGEEFGIIFDGCDIAQAWQICERLREAVAREVMPTSSGARVSVTASAGIADLRKARSRDDAMIAADNALYAAKAAGRDRLAIAA